MIIDDWGLLDTHPCSTTHSRTLFCLSNGYLGLRGTMEEESDIADQAFVNGFHQTWPITYPEDAYGLARVGQTIQPVANPTRFRLSVDGEEVNIADNQGHESSRRLDFRTGLLTRSATWTTSGGATVWVESSRMISFVHRGLALMTYRVTPTQAVDISLINTLTLPHATGEETGADPRRATRLKNPLEVTAISQTPRLSASIRTTASHLSLTTVVSHRVLTLADVSEHTGTTEAGPWRGVTAHLEPDQPLILIALAYTAPEADQAHAHLDRLESRTHDDLMGEQRGYLERWWRTADVEVEAPTPIQGMIRANLFHALQACARADGLGIGAKGVTGAGYDGHYFWDCEAMTLPYLTHADPPMARHALSYRYSTLPQARRRAEELHLRGAAFPWRTINGEEASAFFEAGTAQFHINADIAYGANRYLEVAGDMSWLADEGIDLLVETARVWISLGFTGRDGRFHIHGVTGPDEYTALVDDNLYTNVMAATNLEAANRWLDRLSLDNPDGYCLAIARLHISEAERRDWNQAAATMAIPFDDELGVHGQDADFLSHEVWDFAHTPEENFPLLLHYHPATIYRYQVLKQADVVLALITRPDMFTWPQKRADFDYYDPLTTGDSTLSAPGQSIIAAEVGHPDLAEQYFMDALVTDLEDSHNNTGDGIHVASAAAIWATVVMGFAGMRDYGGVCFDPHLPQTWNRLAFTVRFQATPLHVEITHTSMVLRLVNPDAGDEVTVIVRGQPHILSPTARTATITLA